MPAGGLQYAADVMVELPIAGNPLPRRIAVATEVSSFPAESAEVSQSWPG
jgi:hypothetical protein